MEDKPRKKIEVLSVREKNDLRNELHDLERSLKEAEGYGKGTAGEQLDRTRINRQIRRYKKILHQSTPVLTGPQKDRLYKESKRLGEKIREGMPTYSQMQQPEKHPGIVFANLQWERAHAQDIQRWKKMQRILNPDNPCVSNVEMLRKRK